MYIRLMKSADAVLGRLVAVFTPDPTVVHNLAPVRNILLIRPGGIGDAVHLIPTINALKAATPDVIIDILAEKRNSAIFGLCPQVSTVFHYDRPLELLRALRNRYDVVIDTEQWHRLSAVVARMTRAPLLSGFGTNERSRLFTHPIGYSHDTYEAVSFLQLLAPLNIVTTDYSVPFLTIPPQAAASVQSLLSELASRPFVVIFPGASIPERRWGKVRLRRVAEFLLARGIGVVVVGGSEDKEQGDYIISGLGGVNLAGKTSLLETAAVIDRCLLLVSGDSGVLHIAVGLNVPTVSLFGPGRVKKWAPRGERHIVINKELPCSPCTAFGTTPPCPNGNRCMSDITVDEVVNAVTKLLTRVGAMSL